MNTTTTSDIKAWLSDVAGKAGFEAVDFEVETSEHADFAANLAFKLAASAKLAPREVAQTLLEALTAHPSDFSEATVASVELAGPGYLNIRLKDSVIAELALSAVEAKAQPFVGQVVVTEYSDPNPFKVLHVGHLYTSVVGDAISNLIEAGGGEVHRVNFGGDVGRHVAITMWAILRKLGGEDPQRLAAIPEAERSEWMAANYVVGTQAYEDDADAKAEITELNTRIYAIINDGDHDSPLAQIYWTCRGWSYDYFNAFYARIGTKFEKYYPESITAPVGLATVQEQTAKGVYEESDGAVIFKGEPYGLHTRVFINAQGLPTYEAKDVGLIMAKWADYHFDRSVIITGNDITEYMKVVLKSIEQFAPELAERTTHLTHGNVKLAGGVKMASRKGNFLRAVDVLDMVTEASSVDGRGSDESVVLGAIKYAFLKSRIGADIVFIPEESVSLEGNSGPYLQYAHARARSILAKVSGEAATTLPDLEPSERILARKIAEYPEVFAQAATWYMPHFICTYLYDLAQTFNRFYESNRVVGDPREASRRVLIEAYANVLRDGLQLLGIGAPDRL